MKKVVRIDGKPRAATVVQIPKKIGFWYSADEPLFPMPVANSDTLSSEDRAKLAAYLDAGEEVEHYFGYSSCRICDADGPEMGHADMSDGEWKWPQGLSHYVLKHHVKLPDEFVQHVLGKQWSL